MRIVVAVVVTALLLSGFYFAWESGLIQRLSDHEELVRSLRQSGARGPLFCIALQFLQVVIFMIPGEVTQIAAGYVFGAWMGFVYSVTGIMLGSAFDFVVARFAGRPLVEKLLGSHTLTRIDKALQTKKGKSALFLLFLLPGLPKDAMSYGAGLTNLGVGEFVVVSGLARMPALLFSTLIGSQLYDRDYRAAIITAVVGVVAVVAYYLYERKRNAASEEN
jgi:uncharacterized membrane protein YdjX (TVP38/TMEM64 family)